MATGKHKAATSVTLAPLAEKSAFEQLVAAYWKHAAIAAVAIVGVVVFWHRQREQRTETRRQSWDRLIDTAGMSGFSPTPTATPEALNAVAADIKDPQVGPWARLLEAETQLDKRNYSGARSVLEALKRDAAAHAIARDTWPTSETAGSSSAMDSMLAAIGKQEQWEHSHAALLANPTPPADAPRVRLKTSLGDVTVALYADVAPAHTANFLKLASEGYYNGTKFHKIVANQSIEGGDPNSRGDDSTTWGLGGTDKQVPMESNGLAHFAGVLSAAPGSDPTMSSGSLFGLTCKPVHEWDGQRVVFGVVTEGLEIVRQISKAPVAPNSTDLPAQAVTLDAVEKL